MIIMKEDHLHLMLLPSELLKSRKQKLHLVVSLPTIPWKTLNPNCNSQEKPSRTWIPGDIKHDSGLTGPIRVRWLLMMTVVKVRLILMLSLMTISLNLHTIYHKKSFCEDTSSTFLLDSINCNHQECTLVVGLPGFLLWCSSGINGYYNI